MKLTSEEIWARIEKKDKPKPKPKPSVEIQPITKELLDSLEPYERIQAKKKYREWRYKVRKQDKEEVNKEKRRVRAFIQRERRKQIKVKQNGNKTQQE